MLLGRPATHAFDPTPAPPGRLARLGVVLDASLPTRQLLAVAGLCARAGIEVVWFMDVDQDGPPGVGEPWIFAAAELARGGRTRVGVLVDPARRPAAELATMASSMEGPVASTVELGVLAGPTSAMYLTDLRGALASPESGLRPRLSGVAMDMSDIGPLLAVVDDVVLPGWRFDDLETAADEVRAEAADAGRDPASLGVAALVPVSIGRTGAEASARADADPLFRRVGHPAQVGVFGTLEECQDRVIALAHSGVTDLRCILPEAPDVHDVIAQLTAVAVGTTDVLQPGSLRSPAPPPPPGWGGRPDRPPQPGVSGGSRRR